jgi:cobalt-zinc-cadmium efflux system outer membrane protein
MKLFPGLTFDGGGIWVVVWLAILVAVRAQQPANAPARAVLDNVPLQQLSLAGAQRIAFEKNWDLLAAAAGVDAATAQKIIAHEFPNPTLSLYSSLINVDNHPSGTTEGNGLWERSYDTIFAINQLFEIGGKRRNRKASAQAGFEGAKAQLFDARRTLDVAVAKAYVAAAQAEENVRVLLQSAGTLREEARIAEVRLRAGEISSADRSQIEIIAEQLELNAQSAKSAAAQARVTLEVLLGVAHPDADCVVTDHLETLCAATTPINTNSVGTWRPDVMAAEAAVRKAEADLRFQKAVRVPDPTLQGQYEHQPPDNPNSVGFMVSLPVPLWNRNRGNILAAEAAKEQARLAFEKAKAEAMGDIAVARLAYEDALKRWRSYRESIQPKSEQIRQTKAYAYQKGGTSLLDLLVAERNDNDIRLAAAQAAADTASAGAAFKAATQEIQPSQVTK